MTNKAQIVQYHVTEEAIRAELAKFGELSVDTPAGYEEVRLAIAYCRTTRVEIEGKRVELKADALAYGRKVDAVAKSLTAILEDAESPLRAMKQAVDDEKARVKREREETERRAIEAKIRAEREAEEARLAKLRAVEEKRLRVENERLASERAAFAAEQERARRTAEEASQKALREERARQAEADAKTKAERDAMQAERDALAAEQKKIADARAATERAELERVAKLRAEEEAKAQAERDRIAAEEASVAEAERVAAHKARLEALRPDMEKLEAYAAAVLAVDCPKLKTKEATALYYGVYKNLVHALSMIHATKSEAAE